MVESHLLQKRKKLFLDNELDTLILRHSHLLRCQAVPLGRQHVASNRKHVLICFWQQVQQTLLWQGRKAVGTALGEPAVPSGIWESLEAAALIPEF